MAAPATTLFEVSPGSDTADLPVLLDEPSASDIEAAEQASALASVLSTAQLPGQAPAAPEEPFVPPAPPEQRRRPAVTPNPAFPKPDETRILTIANQKGGVGKTTSAVNMAAALAAAGLKVLVLDVDPQGNASTALGIEHHEEVPGVYEVLVEGRPLVEVVQRCEEPGDLWCAPATIDLAGAEIELVSMVARESRLQRALAAYLRQVERSGEGRIDYVLIDCPPSLGLLTINAFVAAPEVLIPIQCEYYALEGLTQLLSNIDLIRQHLNPDLHVSTILLTMYDGRTRLAAQVVDEVRSHFGEQVLQTLVPRSVRISEAPSHGKSVIAYDPTSSGALAYLEAARELAARGARPEEGPGGAGSSPAHAEVGGRTAPDPWSRWSDGTAGRRGTGRGEGTE
ncbi:ParA family protein [Kineococcus sp. NUM-3379]